MIGEVIDLLSQGSPYIWPRTASDYWLYSALFSSTCPVAPHEDTITGVVIAIRSQDHPDDIYIQDVMTHAHHRRQGIAKALINSVCAQGEAWGCGRLYLTSEPENTSAHHAWGALGFVNVPGDHRVNGVEVITDFKGPGKTRAVYELHLR